MAATNMQVINPALNGTTATSNLQDDGSTAITWAVATEPAVQYLNDGRVVLQITKGATNGKLVVKSQLEVSGLTVSNREVTITANTTKLYGPFPPNIHNQSGTNAGYTEFHFEDDVTGLEVTAYRLP